MFVPFHLFSRVTSSSAMPFQLALLLLSGCFESPVKNVAESVMSGASDENGNRIVDTQVSSEGIEIAEMAPSETETQVITASQDGSVFGTRVSFPPGSLSIPTNVTMETAEDIASETSLAELQVDTEIESTGPSVAIQSGEVIDASQPFTISINPPDGVNFSLVKMEKDASDRIVVLYSVAIASTNSYEMGIIPRSELEILDGKITFETMHFGVFQSMILKKPPAKQVKKAKSELAKTKREMKDLPKISVNGRSSFVVRTGESVTIEGKNFKPTVKLALAGKIIDEFQVADNGKNIKFITPESQYKLGLQTLYMKQDGQMERVSLFIQPNELDLPLITLDESKVCAGILYYNQQGQRKEGKRICDERVVEREYEACKEAGQKNCIANDDFPTMAIKRAGSNTSPSEMIEKISSLVSMIQSPNGFTFWDKSGQAHNLKGLANLKPENIKKNVHIAGHEGQYPSASYPLDGNTRVNDLNNGNFYARIKSSEKFEYWSSDGTRHEGTGDSDILPENIASGKSIFMTSGSLGNTVPSSANQCIGSAKDECETDAACRWNGSSCQINPWNIRAGIQIAGVLGQIKTSCRNRVNSNIYNSDQMPPGNNKTIAGAQKDWWDTTDNLKYDNASLPGEQPEGWTSDHSCGPELWSDVTADGSCDSDTENCMMKDNVTGLIWSESHPIRDEAPGAQKIKWSDAVAHCDQLAYGLQGDWRLPTQMELMTAYSHGIKEVMLNTNFALQAEKYWSATTRSDRSDEAYTVRLGRGEVDDDEKKESKANIICVRSD